MRLDKFLKVSRLIKRRTVANTVSEMGRVLVNGNGAKPAKQRQAVSKTRRRTPQRLPQTSPSKSERVTNLIAIFFTSDVVKTLIFNSNKER